MNFRNRRVVSFTWLPAALIAGSFALVACGGDDDGGSSPPSDEQYVANLCDAMATMNEDFEEAFSDLSSSASLDDIEDAMGEVADIVKDAADAIANANPPEDAEEINDQLVETLRDFADALESGDIAALQNFSPPDFQGSPDLEARLEAAAADVEECQDAGIF